MSNDNNNLIDSVKEFNRIEDYETVISLLSPVVDSKNDKNLYYEYAKALYGLNIFNKALDYFYKAYRIDPNFTQAIIGISSTYRELGNLEKALLYANKVLELDPNNGGVYCNLGIIKRNLRSYDEALQAFNQSLSIQPDYFPALNGRGNVYADLKQYEKAIQDYNNAIKIEKNHSSIPYNGKGFAYYKLKNYRAAIQNYNKAIKIRPTFAPYYKNKGDVYNAQEKYRLAIKNYKQFLEVEKKYPNNEALKRLIINQIDELENKINDKNYKSISDLIYKIKSILLFTESHLSHYTSLSAANSMILQNSQFRLSEGSFLNDTSEGRELFKYLNFPSNQPIYNDAIPEIFTEKPFIGSFVPDKKHDDLTLWRMYGKEANLEAQGCAITLNREDFIKSIKLKSEKDLNNEIQSQDLEQLIFYRVAYKADKGFIIPGKENDEENLNKYMDELQRILSKLVLNESTHKKIQNIIELLNDIAFLFKSSEYQYENEIRLVINGVSFEKIVCPKTTPPKVYIELTEIPSIVKKITLGPKVNRADEWAAAFNYSLKNSKNEAEIVISHLPFK